MAAYEETLISISLDADASIAYDTTHPTDGKVAPAGGSVEAGFQYRFVRVTANGKVGLYTNTNGEVAIGVLQSKPQVVDMAATVAISGISLVESGGEVAAGATVSSDATGRAVVGGLGSPCGVAIYPAAAAGELIPVLIRVTTAGSTTA